ncbi:unnamed protein product, partial [Mycena citricolor]
MATGPIQISISQQPRCPFKMSADLLNARELECPGRRSLKHTAYAHVLMRVHTQVFYPEFTPQNCATFSYFGQVVLCVQERIMCSSKDACPVSTKSLRNT